MLINFAKGSKMFDGVFIASLNGIVSNLVKEVEAEVILKNGNFHHVKYHRY